MVAQSPSIAFGASAHVGGSGCHTLPLDAAGGRGRVRGEPGGRAAAGFLCPPQPLPGSDQGSWSRGILGLLHHMVRPLPAQWPSINQLELVSITQRPLSAVSATRLAYWLFHTQMSEPTSLGGKSLLRAT